MSIFWEQPPYNRFALPVSPVFRVARLRLRCTARILTVQTLKRRDRPLAAPPPARVARITIWWCGKAGAGDRRRAANCSHPITDPNVCMILDHFSPCRPIVGGGSNLVTLPDQNSGRVLMLLRAQMVFFRQPRMLASSTGVIFCAGTRTTARKQHEEKGRKEQVY
jgi:hypothetical protein